MFKRASIGIDIGGTKTLFTLFDEAFRVVEAIKVKTEAERDEKAFTDKLSDSTKELLKTAEKKDLGVLSVGIGCAGRVDRDKGILKVSPNIPFLKGYPLRSRLAKLTGAQVYLTNDVQAGLYGELRLGSAVGCKHVIGVFLGTGIGAAIVLDGKLYYGATGAAGDLGHYLLHPEGSFSKSGRESALDDLASRTAIAGEAAALAAKQWAPHLAKDVGTDVKKIGSKDLAEAIEKGDKSIEDLVRHRAQVLGFALSNIVDFLNPEMIVLGGGLTDAMPKLIQSEVEEGIRNYATADAREGLKVTVSKLKDHAVTTGAAKLSVDVLLAADNPPEKVPVAR